MTCIWKCLGTTLSEWLGRGHRGILYAGERVVIHCACRGWYHPRNNCPTQWQTESKMPPWPLLGFMLLWNPYPLSVGGVCDMLLASEVQQKVTGHMWPGTCGYIKKDYTICLAKNALLCFESASCHFVGCPMERAMLWRNWPWSTTSKKLRPSHWKPARNCMQLIIVLTQSRPLPQSCLRRESSSCWFLDCSFLENQAKSCPDCWSRETVRTKCICLKSLALW